MPDLLQANPAFLERLLGRDAGMGEKYEDVLVSGLDQLRAQGRTQRRIQHNPQQWPAPWQAAPIRQQRIIGENSSHSGDQRIRGVAHPVHFGASFLAGDPIGSTGKAFSRRDAAIERGGNLHGDERKPSRDKSCEAIVEPAGRLRKHTSADFNATRAELGDAHAVDRRVGVDRCHHDPFHSRG